MKKTYVILLFVTILSICCDMGLFSISEGRGESRANCIIFGNIFTKEDRSGNILFTGNIKNYGDAKAYFVKITLTVEYISDRPDETVSSYVESIHLEGGQCSTFQCTADGPYSDYFDCSYKITWDEESDNFFIDIR